MKWLWMIIMSLCLVENSGVNGDVSLQCIVALLPLWQHHSEESVTCMLNVWSRSWISSRIIHHCYLTWANHSSYFGLEVIKSSILCIKLNGKVEELVVTGLSHYLHNYVLSLSSTEQTIRASTPYEPIVFYTHNHFACQRIIFFHRYLWWTFLSWRRMCGLVHFKYTTFLHAAGGTVRRK